MPSFQEAEPLAIQAEVSIHSWDIAPWIGLATVDGCCTIVKVSLRSRCLHLVPRTKQEWTLPDKTCGDSSSLQLPAVLEGFLANAVLCCECGRVTGQAGVCVRVGKVGARNRLPPPQQITWPADCSSPFAREALGQESSQKVGDTSYSGSVTLLWLAGTPRDECVGGSLFWYLCCVLQAELLGFLCRLSLMLLARPCM